MLEPVEAPRVGLDRPTRLIPTTSRHQTTIRLAQLALDVVPGPASGCSRHDPTRFPAHAGRVPGPLRVRGGLPALPGGVPLAGRLPLPAMRRAGRLRAGRTGAPAVPGVPAPDLGDGGHGPAPDARPPPALVRGGVPGHHPHAGGLGGPAPAPAPPRPGRDRPGDAAPAPARDAPP